MKTMTKCWIGLGALALLSPLGLLLPHHFRSGRAWGEWRSDEVGALRGYIPKGLAKLSDLWKAPMPDYAFHGLAQKGLTHLSLAYIVSAVVGMGLVVGVMWLVGRFLAKKNDANAADK